MPIPKSLGIIKRATFRIAGWENETPKLNFIPFRTRRDLNQELQHSPYQHSHDDGDSGIVEIVADYGKRKSNGGQIQEYGSRGGQTELMKTIQNPIARAARAMKNR